MERIRCTSHLGEYAASLIGVPVAGYLHSAELMANAHLEAFRLLRQDGVSVGPDLFGLAEAMGAKLLFSGRDRPQVRSPAASELRQAAALPAPEPRRDGRLPLYLEALERIRDGVRGRVPVGSGISGPFTTACFLRGTEALLMDLEGDPRGVHALLDTATQGILAYMEACLERGFSCSMGDPMAACALIGPNGFRSVVKPHLARIAAWVRERTGRGPSLHVCGDVRPVLEDMAEAGVSGLKVDENVDLNEAKALVGHRLALSGNIPSLGVLLKGSPDTVRGAAVKALEAGWDNPRGFVLSAGCSVAMGTPTENLKALVQTARAYRRHDP
jgi:uroporphyrinogen decarboxylase